MSVNVLSIAGLDPSGGAGLLADIKTYQALRVQGFGIASAITVQNESDLKEIHWLDEELIMAQIDIILNRHAVAAIKIGVTRTQDCLERIIKYLKKQCPSIIIIWDPVFKSSGGFEFWDTVDIEQLSWVLDHIDLITPNLEEYKRLWAGTAIENVDCKTNILLKSAGVTNDLVSDQLRWKNKVYHFNTRKLKNHDKHGTGCVLSAALAANTALGYDFLQAYKHAHSLLQEYMLSSTSLLGEIPLNIK